MHVMKYASLVAVASLGLVAVSANAAPQISVNIGVAPACPYGYYEAPPYSCAPYGYYGPEWFHGSTFVGAGPWFHGPSNFQGHVDNHFAPENYHGPAPHAGDKPEKGREHPPANFKGNEQHDGKGHVGGRK